MRTLLLVLMLAFGSSATAHEMTPTYPKFEVSYMAGVSVTTMSLFNKRKDVSYYEIGVFTGEWKPVAFVSQYTVIPMLYLDTVSFDVYVSTDSIESIEYICSISRLMAGATVSSKICSRVK